MKPRDFRRATFQLEMITVRERLREILLVRHQQDAAHLAAQVLQLLDHYLPPLAVEAAEAFVDDDRLDGPVLPAGVLADAERQADGHAELLTAAQELHIDRLVAG